MRAAVTGWVPTGVLDDEMAVVSGHDYAAAIGHWSMSPQVNALISGAHLDATMSAEELDFMRAATSGLIPTGVLEQESE